MSINEGNGFYFNEDFHTLEFDEIEEIVESDEESLYLKQQKAELAEFENRLQSKESKIADIMHFRNLVYIFQKENMRDLKEKILRSAQEYHKKGDPEKPLSLGNPSHNAKVRILSGMTSWWKFIEQIVRICYPDVKGSAIIYGRIICDQVINPVVNGDEINIEELDTAMNQKKKSTEVNALKNLKIEVKKIRAKIKKTQGEINLTAIQIANPGLDGIETRNAKSSKRAIKKTSTK